jgi:hypothetical protein
MLNDVLRDYERSSRATRLSAQPYQRARTRPKRSRITLSGSRFATLFVETGVARNRWGRFPYANFEFNLDALISCIETQQSFLRVMQDLLPSGGYADLVDDGYVLHVEFAIDFEKARMSELEFFHPRMSAGRRVGEASTPPDTVYLNARQNGTASYCIYDKRKQLLRTHYYLRRSRMRVEARWRLNNTPRLRETRVRGLDSLPNPFEDLVILDREVLDEVFQARRHTNFLRNVHAHGLQHALRGNRTVDQERRIRMLSQAVVPWWNPHAIWQGRHAAFQSIVTLTRPRATQMIPRLGPRRVA